MSDGRIVLTGQDAAQLAQMVEALEAAGFEVEPCHTPQEALARTEATRPDLLIVEQSRSGTEALLLLRALSARMAAGELPIILLTPAPAERGAPAIDMAAWRAITFLHGPLPADQLVAHVRRVLAGEARPAEPILVVDDDMANLEMIERRLEVEGFRTVLASTGTQAIELAREREFQAVLLDLRLPDVSGLEVMAAIQAARPQIPVLIMTAHGSESLAVKTLTAGAADYLIKPVGRRELVSALRNAIERNRLEQENARIQRRLEETVEALQRSLEAAERDRRRLAELTETLDEGVLLLGPYRRVEQLNLAGKRMLGVTAPVETLDDLIGRVREVEREDGSRVDLAAFQPNAVVTDAEYIVRFHDGTEKAMSVSAKPLAGAGARYGGRLIVFRDVTEKRTRRLRLEALLGALESEVRVAHEQRRVEVERASLEAERVKNEIFSVISHELRTPLNFIVGFGSVLADGVAGELTREQVALVEKMLMGAERLTAAVEDLLNYAMLTSGMLEAQQVPVPLTAIAAEVVEQLRPEARERELAIAWDAPAGDRLEAPGDPELLRHVVRHLAANAVKFTPAGGRVTVRVGRQSDGSPCLAVTDTGIGIAPEALPHLFDRFYQAERHASRRFGGTGMGLALVKGLAELMGLRITVASAPGEGSTFTLLWPAG